MKRSPILAVVAALILVVLVLGCTYQRPAARDVAPTSPASTGGTTAAAPAGQVGNTPTPTPTTESTTIATQPTATPTSTFSELAGGPTTSPTVEATAPPEAESSSAEAQDTGSEDTSTADTGSSGISTTEGQYTVRWGDTLFSIAQNFGTTVDAIQEANGLSGDFITVGQELAIPGALGGPTDTAPSSTGGPGVHIVQPGETLFRIALRYGITVDSIAQANSIVNPWFIYVGQELVVPASGAAGQPIVPSGKTHVVQPGDTLYSIAVRYDTTVQALMIANNLPSPHLIYVGQILNIP